MTKNAAIQDFFEGFGLNAFPSASVPTEGADVPDFPYLTYDFIIGTDMDRITSNASLWYRSDSWLGVNAKAWEISRAIGRSKVIPCDDGALILRRASPFIQPMGDENDDKIKRNVLQFDVTFVTTD